MTRSVFGWDLPPGCTQRMIDEAFGGEGPCECCGRAAEECICPECPDCSRTGDPGCYEHHTIAEFTTDQLIGQTRLRISRLEEQIADEKHYLDWLTHKKERGERGELPFTGS